MKYALSIPGTLELTIEKVCGIHTLADKYDIPPLKEDCLCFMKDVLTGVHGDALEAALQWLTYIESFLPDMVHICHKAIRTNFMGISHKDPKMKGKLSTNQAKNIFTINDKADEIVVDSEGLFFSKLLHLCHASDFFGLLPLVRFHNMDIEHLQHFQSTYKNLFPNEEVFNQAYKIQAERAGIVNRSCKKRRLSNGNEELKCACDASIGKCPHIDPRLYCSPPYGVKYFLVSPSTQVAPTDVTNIEKFVQKIVVFEDKPRAGHWKVERICKYEEDPIYESYQVVPAPCDLGKRFSMAITCMESNPSMHRYSIKYTGTVQTFVNGAACAKPVSLKSPLRVKDSWKIDNKKHTIGVCILLLQ